MMCAECDCAARSAAPSRLQAQLAAVSPCRAATGRSDFEIQRGRKVRMRRMRCGQNTFENVHSDSVATRASAVLCWLRSRIERRAESGGEYPACWRSQVRLLFEAQHRHQKSPALINWVASEKEVSLNLEFTSCEARSLGRSAKVSCCTVVAGNCSPSPSPCSHHLRTSDLKTSIQLPPPPPPPFPTRSHSANPDHRPTCNKVSEPVFIPTPFSTGNSRDCTVRAPTIGTLAQLTGPLRQK